MPEAVTVAEALKRASSVLRQAGFKEPRLEAELLLGYLLKKDRLALVLGGALQLADKTYNDYTKLIERRKNHEPLAYITGNGYFYRRSFLVTPDVLIPRPETELIVRLALKYLQQLTEHDKTPCLLDIGTGSGALAVTLAIEVPSSKVWATDVSAGALKVAALNAKASGTKERIYFRKGSYYQALEQEPGLSFDLIVANPPYIESRLVPGLPETVRLYEPEIALNGGPDGLDSYRAICAGLKERLKQGGMVLLEISTHLQSAVEELLAATGLFKRLYTHSDLAGRPRVVEAI